MPVVTLYHDKLIELIGKDVSFEELAHDLIPMLGSDVERIDEREGRIDAEFFPNRPDLYSVEGVARALKGFMGIEKGLPEYEVFDTDIEVEVDESVCRVRPVIAVATVEGIEFEDDRDLEHLMEFQEHLHWVIGRDRKKAAIGIHDLDAVEPPLRYLAVDPDDDSWSFEPLDRPGEVMKPSEVLRKHEKGREYGHLVGDLVPILADEEGVISMPPVINSERTKVTLDTERVLVDVTGTSWRTVLDALHVVVCNLAERGGKIGAVRIFGAYERVTPTMKLDVWDVPVREASSLLGVELKGEELEDLLARARHEVVFLPAGEDVTTFPSPTHYHIEADWEEEPPVLYDEDVVRAFVGPWRTNVLHVWDLVEDAGIMYRYDRFEPRVPEVPGLPEASDDVEFASFLRDVISRLGFVEVNSLTLTSPFVNYEAMRLEVDEEEPVIVANPIQKEYTILRTWVLPSLMLFLSDNKHRPYPQRVFEVGEIVKRDPDAETGAVNRRDLALAEAGPDVGFADVKAVVEALLRELDLLDRAEVEEFEHPSFIKGRCAAVTVNGNRLGFFGEVHPEVLENFDLEVPVVAAEFELEALKKAVGW